MMTPSEVKPAKKAAQPRAIFTTSYLPIDDMLRQTIEKIKNGQFDFDVIASEGKELAIEQDSSRVFPVSGPGPIENNRPTSLPRATPLEVPGHELLQPSSPSVETCSTPGKINKITELTTRILAEFQRRGELTVGELVGNGFGDDRRIYEIMNGLQWIGLIKRRPTTKAYRYCGPQSDLIMDGQNSAEILARMQREREEKVERLRQLNDELFALKIKAGVLTDIDRMSYDDWGTDDT
jgi:hypothetical protein